MERNTVLLLFNILAVPATAGIHKFVHADGKKGQCSRSQSKWILRGSLGSLTCLALILSGHTSRAKASILNVPQVPRIDSVSPLETQPHETDAHVIWYDNFDQGRKPYGEGSGDLDSQEAFGQTGKSMHCFYNKGSRGTGGRKVFFGDSPTGGNRIVRPGETYDEIYFRLYVKHEVGWTGGHPAKLARATSLVTGQWAQAMIAHVWGSGKDAITLDPASGVKGHTVVTRKYNDFSNLKWLGNKPMSEYPISATSESGYWVLLECRVKLNTPGKSDGLNQLWIDGRLECERRNLNLRGQYDKHGINAVFLESYWNQGSPVKQSRWYDNFVISTQPIGPVECPANPVLIKTPYRGPGKLAQWVVQLASDFEGNDVVFRSDALAQSEQVTVNASRGTFVGSLAGSDRLAHGKTYYARVQQTSTTGTTSDWSRWHQGFVVSDDTWREPTITRQIPTVTGSHIFIEGQVVTVPIPADQNPRPTRWQLLDDRQAVVVSGMLAPKAISIKAGTLGIGWYRVEFLNSDGHRLAWTTTAVLARQHTTVSQDSPVCLDSATAWFARDDAENQDNLARLASLARVNWVRDRMKWRDMESAPGIFEASTTYDTAAEIHAKYGLKVLQVFHDTPPWAMKEKESRGRYASDLRHPYRFGKAMAQRFKGQVQAWEPWNEGNVSDFGGHTADEMCAYQKAAYLGFKAGDPNVIVCWNVSTATPTALHTQVVLENRTWPYFDTYNIHTYDWPDSYERLWKPVHDAACGRPIWITESDRGIQYETPEPWCDLSPENEIRKAEFMAQSYASSFYAGANKHFHFILGHYFEARNKVQFGLLRLDQTPRPSYVAMAAIGRFLDGAKCLGRWALPDKPQAHIYAFKARPDGHETCVLVAWAEKPGDWNQRGKTQVDWALPEGMAINSVYDYLGRSLGNALPGPLCSAPVFIVLEPDQAHRLELTPPPQSTYREGRPSHIVLQLNMPRVSTVKLEQIPWASEYEHKVEPGTETELPVYVYNFEDERARGTIVVSHSPSGWTLSPRQWRVTLEPMERRLLKLRLTKPDTPFDAFSDNWIKLTGNFGTEEQPVLAFRCISKPGEGYNGKIRR